MRTVLVLAAVMGIPATAADAQAVPFSQHGSVSQRVAFTDIAVDYNRPVARGREIFGDLVPWDRTWHPGADSATRISFSRDVEIEGRRIPAGRYSLWTIPRERGSWTVILSRAADVFHTPYPGEEHDLVRFGVLPEQGSHMETLAFYFPVVDRELAVLRLHWAETVLPLRITASSEP